MSDEQAILNRLLAREAQLKACAKSFAALSANLDQWDADETERQVELLQKNLLQYEFAVTKAQAMMRTSVRQISENEASCRDVDEEMKQVQTDIELLTTKLVDARAQRDHKEQCAALERVINELPSRDEMNAEIKKLEAELEALTGEGDSLSRDLEHRQLQFATLMHSVVELQSQLKAEAAEQDEPAPMAD